ncbi:WhiB family transcriptional regulator [Propionicicella superfundia]|uniref:WhiB family transcriptional regulator n=1 Tax=Propionicicella superfundia TaxID=348582 RepID=UPI003CCBA6B9
MAFDGGRCRAASVEPYWFDETARAKDQARALAICDRCQLAESCLARGTRVMGSGVWGGEVLHEGRVLKHPSTRGVESP